jgi:predicted permease
MSLLRKLRSLFRKEKLDAEMAEEMRAHLEQQMEANIARGMSADEARYAAHRQFGGVEQIKEQARDQRGWRWLDELTQDVRYGTRLLRKNPGFAAIAVLTLALGIGANTAIFSLVNEVLLKSLPVKNPQELVLFEWFSGAQGRMARGIEGNSRTDPVTKRTYSTSFSLLTFERFSAEHPALSHVFAFAPISRLNVLVDGESDTSANGQFVSGGYYEGLGVSAFMGRALDANDDRPGADPVAVISHRYWQRRFNGSPDALGRTVLLNKVPVTIVGITPPEFAGTQQVGESIAFSVPLALQPRLQPDDVDKGKPWSWWLRMMGRLSTGSTVEQARVSLEGSFQQAALEGWTRAQSLQSSSSEQRTPDAPGLLASPGGQGLNDTRAGYAPSLRIMMGLAGMVLLISCANVANLLLARGAARRREIGVRLALGASRRRIVRQLLGESLLLASLGAGLGLIFAAWGREALLALRPLGRSLVLELPIDWRVLGFTTAAGVFTALLAGLAPALRATQVDLTAEFQGGTRSSGAGGRSRLAHVLMVAQISLSLVLLVSTGLFVRTLRNLQAIDPGFNRERLVMFGLDLVSAGYTRPQFAAFHTRVAERLERIPAVRSATFSALPLLSQSARNTSVSVQGYTRPTGVAGGNSAMVNVLAPDFFETLEIPLVLGRGFTTRDDLAAPKVAVISQAMAKKYFGTDNPVGRRLGFGDASTESDIEIVGVVRDAKYRNLRSDSPITVYTPALQAPPGTAHYTLRTAGEPAAVFTAIQAAVREIDSTVPVLMLRTLDDQIDMLHARERLFARLAGFFGLLAMMLVSIGLYGLMAYTVLRRTGEIGIRMALGALPAQVLRMVLRESLTLVFLGVLAGLALSMAAGRFIASMLFGLSTIDPLTYGAVALLLLVVALLAAWLPAQRAARVSPMIALRCE